MAYQEVQRHDFAEHTRVTSSCTIVHKLELNESGKMGSKTVTSTLLLKQRKVKTKNVYEVKNHMQAL